MHAEWFRQSNPSFNLRVKHYWHLRKGLLVFMWYNFSFVCQWGCQNVRWLSTHSMLSIVTKVLRSISHSLTADFTQSPEAFTQSVQWVNTFILWYYEFCDREIFIIFNMKIMDIFTIFIYSSIQKFGLSKIFLLSRIQSKAVILWNIITIILK